MKDVTGACALTLYNQELETGLYLTDRGRFYPGRDVERIPSQKLDILSDPTESGPLVVQSGIW